MSGAWSTMEFDSLNSELARWNRSCHKSRKEEENQRRKEFPADISKEGFLL